MVRESVRKSVEKLGNVLLKIILLFYFTKFVSYMKLHDVNTTDGFNYFQMKNMQYLDEKSLQDSLALTVNLTPFRTLFRIPVCPEFMFVQRRRATHWTVLKIDGRNERDVYCK